MNRKVIYSLFMMMAVFLLASCGTAEPITVESEGIWNRYFIYPLSYLLTFVANFVGGNYGLAIIIVTLAIRLLLFPLNVQSIKSSQAMQHLKPELNKLREKYLLSSNRDMQMKFQEELMQLYSKHQVNPMAGCMPIFMQLFIQFPILLALYYAIIRTEIIAQHSFLWFDLGAGDPFFLLPLIAAMTTYLQLRLTRQSLPQQMNMLIYVMPVLIFIVAFAVPSALALYWIVGNLFSIGQTYVLQLRSAKNEG